MRNQSTRGLIVTGLCCALLATSAQAGMLTYNSTAFSGNNTARANWLAGAGIASPAYLVDFESGFTDDQNISGVTGLFPAGLVITSTNSKAFIESGAGSIGGSNPVGTFALQHTDNTPYYLTLDFSAQPANYVGWLDIDHSTTSGQTVTFLGGGTAPFTLDETEASGDSAEFFGIFRNDMPPIIRVQFGVNGSAGWGLDNIEYGPAPAVPVPGAALLGVLGLSAAGWRLRRKTA